MSVVVTAIWPGSDAERWSWAELGLPLQPTLDPASCLLPQLTPQHQVRHVLKSDCLARRARMGRLGCQRRGSNRPSVMSCISLVQLTLRAKTKLNRLFFLVVSVSDCLLLYSKKKTLTITQVRLRRFGLPATKSQVNAEDLKGLFPSGIPGPRVPVVLSFCFACRNW